MPIVSIDLFLFKGETKVALNNVESNFRVIEIEAYALEIYYAR